MSTLTDSWNGSPVACATYDTVLVAFTGISGGDSWVIQGSLSGTNYKTLLVTNLTDNSTISSITADGIYAVPACGFVKYTKTGSASTPTIDMLLKR